MKNGIDISQFQGVIDFSRLVTDFAVIRAGYGRLISQKDARFEDNYRGCIERDIPVGAYWYSYAVTPEDARTEARVFLDVIKGKRFLYPVYLDIEEPRQTALGREKCSAVAEAFLETVEGAGYFAGIYSNSSTLENFISADLRSRYTVWVADYGVSKPNYKGSYSMWQRTNTGSVLGINGNVDLDRCYEDFPSIIKAAGLNGYGTKRTLKIDSLTANGITYSGTLTEI